MAAHPCARLRVKPNQPIPSHRLPFVGCPKRGGMLHFWHVPAKGGYGGGCTTGKALAYLYLKHLRQHGMSPGGLLQVIAQDMLGGGKCKVSRRGQAVGFFFVLDVWLEAAARHLGGTLDGMEAETLLARANAGLGR